jgi:excinuclease ABC subunit A
MSTRYNTTFGARQPHDQMFDWCAGVVSLPRENVVVYGAREHNLKDITVEIPRDSLVVFTGVSGSGKSSLAFDTIYAEGQRRYVESLSTYARQFMDRMERPKVDHIEGLSPAIAIEQRSAGGNPRSTVGTVTEIHDYLRVLYARVGAPHCHLCGRQISTQTPEQIVDRLLALPEGTRLQVLAPVVRGRRGEYRDTLQEARRAGFARVRIDGRLHDLAEPIRLDERLKHDVEVVVDRVVVKEGLRARLTESVETALRLGDGLVIASLADGEDLLFSERFACPDCGTSFGELSPQMFSFNSPHGMCPECSGLGVVSRTDPDLIVADASKSIEEGAIALWGELSDVRVHHVMEGLSRHYGFSLGTPWKDLTDAQKRAILFGSQDEEIEFHYRTRAGREYRYRRRFEGLVAMSARRLESSRSSATRDYHSRFVAEVPCPSCGGARLRPESLAVRIAGKSIAEVTAQSVATARGFFAELSFPNSAGVVAEQLLKEIRARLEFLCEVGLDYLTLDRAANSLSGGEAQRIRLATQIGSRLMGVLYILDEPTIGLHPRDTGRLLNTLTRLRDLGNTVIVVEHDPAMIRAADWVIDFGPGAGTAGGQVVFAGTVADLQADSRSLTGQFLSGRRSIPIPRRRRRPKDAYIEIIGASEHNLQSINVRFPVGLLTCVTGVSGSGKSTLVADTLYPALARRLRGASQRAGRHEAIRGVAHVDRVIDVDQSPIGRTPRSNPATYVGALTPIRQLFAETREARVRGYGPGRFSFNVRGGRCEACEGDGVIRVEMHFLPDVYVTCEACGGTRYNRETLQVTYRGRSIAEVLEMTVAEALQHFDSIPKVKRILQTLADVGMDYIRLGQPATTLSGGEAQRVKLARELSKASTGRTVYILDEPTTGLHFADIEKLLEVLNRLVDAGNTVIVIEHNLDVIKTADYVIDLGPEGGEMGGRIVAEGTPEEVAKVEASHTGRLLRGVLSPDALPPAARRRRKPAAVR